MRIIELAGLVYQRNKTHAGAPKLKFDDRHEAIADAVDDRLDKLDARLKRLEAQANRHESA